jgi:hypothetical protein
MLVLAVSTVLFAVTIIVVGVVGVGLGIVFSARAGKDYAAIGKTGALRTLPGDDGVDHEPPVHEPPDVGTPGRF